MGDVEDKQSVRFEFGLLFAENRQGKLEYQVIFMACTGLYIGWSSFLSLGSRMGSSQGMHGPSRFLLCPNDLHGLPFGKLPIGGWRRF